MIVKVARGGTRRYRKTQSLPLLLKENGRRQEDLLLLWTIWILDTVQKGYWLKIYTCNNYWKLTSTEILLCFYWWLRFCLCHVFVRLYLIVMFGYIVSLSVFFSQSLRPFLSAPLSLYPWRWTEDWNMSLSMFLDFPCLAFPCPWLWFCLCPLCLFSYVSVTSCIFFYIYVRRLAASKRFRDLCLCPGPSLCLVAYVPLATKSHIKNLKLNVLFLYLPAVFEDCLS